MKYIGPFLAVLAFWSCQNQAEFALDIPSYVEPFEVPADNPLTKKKVELGRRLFYEKGLSLDSSVSCASCHMQEFAFADTARVSRGFQSDTGFRNSSSLTNVAFQTAFFRDGGVFTLERAVHPPVLGEFEMNMNLTEMLARLKADESYQRDFKNAFGAEVNHQSIVQALASFQRTLISFNSPYDAFLRGDSSALNESEKRGLALFKSEKFGCGNCHKEPLFIDNAMHNIGLYLEYNEFGRGRVTLKKEDFGKFRTPTLRNIAASFPYMHDGSLKSLEAVIDFYATGGSNHPNKSEKMKAIEMTAEEKEDLLSFLNALTDSIFLRNPAFAAPK